MKIAVLNFSGNVGKTTIAIHLLKPRMGDAIIYSIESVNMGADADGIEVEKMKGKKFGDLASELMLLDNAIVDVGASNVEDFLKLMQQYSGSHEEFDLFVVPVVKEQKVQADTINTIRALYSIGIDRKRIMAVFNRVDVDESVEDEFAPVFGFARMEKMFTADPACVIYANEIFERLKSVGKSLGDVTADPTDYRELLRQTSRDDDEQRRLLTGMVAIKRLAVSVNENLDTVHKVLVGRK